MKQLMLSCKKATEMMEKKLTVGLTPLERFQLMVHVAMCDACKTYQRQSALLDRFLAKKGESSDAHEDLPTLPEDVKAKIIRELNNQ